MAWIYFQESEESPSLSKNGLSQSLTVKSNPIAKASSCKECKKGICPKHQFGTIYKRYPTKICPKLTSCMGDFHAKTSVLQDLEKAWRESVAHYFSRSRELAVSYDQTSSSWRTYQRSLFAEGDKWLEHLPRWGMTVDGVLYQLPLLERYIEGNDGSCWPTPMASDHSKSGEAASQIRRKSPCLSCVVKKIATPRASQTSSMIAKPCPSVKKGKHGESTVQSIGRLNPELIGKKLCPRWVSVLMGYRSTWTDLER